MDRMAIAGWYVRLSVQSRARSRRNILPGMHNAQSNGYLLLEKMFSSVNEVEHEIKRENIHGMDEYPQW